MYWDNGKENGNYRDYRDYIGGMIGTSNNEQEAAVIRKSGLVHDPLIPSPTQRTSPYQ